MKNFKSHFKFNKQERSGIFFLLLVIFSLQLIYMLIKNEVFYTSERSFVLDTKVQKLLDSVKGQSIPRESTKMYPLNPNFLSNYKGYALGMSNEEIDRLHLFRSENRWVTSAKGFQRVTHVSDSLLQKIAPLFKFPEWASPSKKEKKAKQKKFSVANVKFKELNQATAEELKVIYGIGDKLSARIIKFRNRLGGFMVSEQLYDVYGLEEEVVLRILEEFRVGQQPEIQKININTATGREMQKLIYINQKLANQIVTYRDSVGIIKSFTELTKIEDFPAKKIDRIKLYLSL
ncbi:helix-hairpin-helix domain-containing protein [uncultured Eudoraea sp.]|uniref:ComEA family DNA-binding protein n=1 Tax=uncultured Eudoraea sp. TaxID=1035614 RepID=UPI002601D11D|nr:helix-hairpin-helix domain-containing protein [uncultured Eudoraea sp.]